MGLLILPERLRAQKLPSAPLRAPWRSALHVGRDTLTGFSPRIGSVISTPWGFGNNVVLSNTPETVDTRISVTPKFSMLLAGNLVAHNGSYSYFFKPNVANSGLAFRNGLYSNRMVFYDGTAAIYSDSGFTITVGYPFIIGLVYDGSKYRWFKDGVSGNVVSGGFTASGTWSYYSLNLEGTTHTSVLHAFANSVVPDSEMKILTVKPWGIFEQPSRRIWAAFPSSVSLALSGNSLSLSSGSLATALSLGLTGNAQSLSVGTPQLGLALELSGQTQSLTVGTLTPAGTYTIALTGSALSFASGVLSPEIELALVGQELSTTAGQLLSAITLGLTGNTETLSAGSLSIAGTGTLDPATIQAIVDAVWSDPRALTLAKFLALKDG
jgi:hypothetical protein